jgi:signal transduction histidine kinase
LVFACLLLAMLAPLFYFFSEKLYLDDADEALQLRKNEFLHYSIKRLKEADIPIWNNFNRDIKIKPANRLIIDTLFYTYYYDTLSQENEPYRELNFPIVIEGKHYTYSGRINLEEKEDLIKNIAVLFFIILSSLLIGILIISTKFSHHLWKPFYKTLQMIEAFEINNSNHPKLAKTKIEEFDRLNDSIEKLIEKNISIYRSQLEFVENAAHELQTPLVVFQATIDNFIQREDVTQQQSEILSTLNDNVARMNRLNKNLLLLSKIENQNYHSKQSFDLKEGIEKQLDFFIEQGKAKNLAFKLVLEEQVFVQSNAVLAEILISNLFLNAIQHNTNHGQVSVTLSKKRLILSNSGEPHPLAKSKLFNRFSKFNPSTRGNGLGLAIVKKIADLNNWSVDYTFVDGLHSFLILF